MAGTSLETPAGEEGDGWILRMPDFLLRCMFRTGI